MGIFAAGLFDPSNPDAQQLLHVLARSVDDKKTMQTMAMLSGVPKGTVDWDGTVDDVWPRLLIQASVRGRLRVLIQKVSEAIVAEPLLRQLLDDSDTTTAQTAVADGDDLFDTPILWDDEPMIDRADLRAHIKTMAGKKGRRALLVTGPDDCIGKTQTRRYISYLAENREVGQVLIIDNSKRAGEPIDVPELAQWIASALLGAEAPVFDKFAQPETLVSRFWGWLANETGRLPRSRWLVFDGFTKTTATDAATQIVTEIARLAADRQLGTIRVAVLGFSGSSSVVYGALCDALRQPTDDEVKRFFAKVAVLVRKQELPEDVIDELFDSFVSRGGAVGNRPLRELGPSALSLAFQTYGVVQ